jgi:1,4-alpha-glucan branching enzyme
MEFGRTDEIVLGPRDSAQRSFGQSPVRFTMRCPGAQAYLLLADAAGRSIALDEMTWDGDAWRLTLNLRPGTYRYRYYINDGRTTAYFSPADADPIGRVTRMDGMDGVFDVAPPFERLPRFSRPGEAAPPTPLRSGYSALAPLSQGYVF